MSRGSDNRYFLHANKQYLPPCPTNCPQGCLKNFTGGCVGKQGACITKETRMREIWCMAICRENESPASSRNPKSVLTER